MWVTPRDLEILARVHDARACDSGALADLFPTAKALQQRLWRMTRAHFLKVHRVGNQRAYSLGPLGARALGLSTKEIRISRGAVARCLSLARIRRKLQAEGYLPNGQDQVGRTAVLRAWRGGRRIAVAVCEPNASPRAAQRFVNRLLRLIDPFEPLVDELMIFGTIPTLLRSTKVSVVHHGRVTIRSLTS